MAIHLLPRGEIGSCRPIHRIDPRNPRGDGQYGEHFTDRRQRRMVNKAFATWLARKAIRHETSAPHTLQQDGVAEKGICSVTEGIRSCL